jgi:hypothetical protein
MVPINGTSEMEGTMELEVYDRPLNQIDIYTPTQLLYMAGGITGISYGGSTDWRKHVADRLPPYIKPISPMRGKEYLAAEKSIKGSYEDNPLSSGRGIMCRDINDVRRCDLVLANFLGAEKPSFGTVIEISIAYALGKPIIIVIEKEGNLHNHPMILQTAGFIVSSLDEAIELAIKVLSTGI